MIKKDVDMVELFENEGDSGVDFFCFRHIGGDEHGFAACVFDFLYELFACFALNVYDADAGSFGGKPEGGGATCTACTAANQDDFAG